VVGKCVGDKCSDVRLCWDGVELSCDMMCYVMLCVM
jgi:hypothetical protein